VSGTHRRGDPEPRAVLELAVGLAREAGALQRQRLDSELRIDTKSSSVDLVTDVDRACEGIIVEGIERARPADAIVAEEGGGRDAPEAPWRWVIDPLDGTTNYAHGYPCFCVSIGVEREGTRTVGVLYDPMRDELFHAVRGEGAFRNGHRIRVSQEEDLGRSLLATGFSYDRHQRAGDSLRSFAAFLRRARGLRRDGSAALDLAAVACGRFDGYWEWRLRPWDVAAGLLVVEEAGGRVSDATGGPAPRSGAEVVASNGRIHDAMLHVLAEGDDDPAAASRPSDRG